MALTPVSLLDRLRRRPLEEDWSRFINLYRPFVERFIRLDPALHADAEDICQNVMAKLVEHLPGFTRERDGSFRAWLKITTVNEVSYFWRQTLRRRAMIAEQASVVWDGLKDPKNELSQKWEVEYTDHVLRRLQQLIEPEFSETTWQAFSLRVHGEKTTEEAAQILGISRNAVDIAKSRVLARLRAEAEGLIES